MTTLPEAREAIYEEFATGWGTLTEYTLDNEKFEPPKHDPWARVSVRHTDGGQETLGTVGSRKFSRTGSVFVQIFTPENSGLSGADALLPIARAIFEGSRITQTTIRFLNVVAREIGLDGKWYQTMVEAAFEYDETK